MKLLLDQNLSPRLIKALKKLYPDSVHVSHIGLDQSVDQEVWNYAQNHQFIIVTKDYFENSTTELTIDLAIKSLPRSHIAHRNRC